MNIRQGLLKEHSKANILRISKYIGNDPEKFAELMDLFLGDNYRITQRAAWVVSYCLEAYPELIAPYKRTMWKNLQRPVHVAVKRNTLRVFQFIPIEKDLQGLAVNICFDTLGNAKETVANKVFAMTVLYNITTEEPELANELRIMIEEQMPYGSRGFVSRGKKILKKLDCM